VAEKRCKEGITKFSRTNTIKNIFLTVTGVGTSQDNLNLPSYASMWTVAPEITLIPFPTGPITAHSVTH